MTNNADIPDAPAPWQLTAETYMFLGYSYQPKLPPGSFDPREETALAAAEHSTLYRTPYCLNIFRYKTSPVGPYDEIMYIPGWYETATLGANGKIDKLKHTRITRIYVSTEASIYNGRKNWNIPKHKADFSFVYEPEGSVQISVSLPGSSEPFFAAFVERSKRLPAVPFSTDWLPISLDLLQPSLPHLDDNVIGTDEWQETHFTIATKKAQVAYITPKLFNNKKFADDISFPEPASIYVGICASDATVNFMVPKTIKVAKLSADRENNKRA